jgi:hypothetical protein
VPGVDDPPAVRRDARPVVDLLDRGLGQGPHLAGSEVHPHDLGEAVAVAHRHGPTAVRGRIGVAQARLAGEPPDFAALGRPEE